MRLCVIINQTYFFHLSYYCCLHLCLYSFQEKKYLCCKVPESTIQPPQKSSYNQSIYQVTQKYLYCKITSKTQFHILQAWFGRASSKTALWGEVSACVKTGAAGASRSAAKLALKSHDWIVLLGYTTRSQQEVNSLQLDPQDYRLYV